MKVTKRDGRVIDFTVERVVNAINKAMEDTVKGLDLELSEQISKEIKSEIKELQSVESIQDIIEDKLMNSNRKDVAKAFILYRNERHKSRKPINNDRLLTDEFISKYKHVKSNMTPLASFVYYRTYSRWLKEEKRREYWWETIRRAVEYNCSLAPTTREEAELLYDNIFNLKQFLSGRTFWVGGTEVSKNYPMGNFNCAFIVIDEFEALSDLFYALMIGTGVGVRVLKSDVEKLPKIRKGIELIHKDYVPIDKVFREDNTSLEFNGDMVKITVGDSKEGWKQALYHYFRILFSKEYRIVNTIIIDYDNVRQKGERLKTFGGTASGHESIKNMFTKMHKVIKNRTTLVNSEYVSLKPIDCLDFANIIGENVVVGGVRRTAEVGLIDTDDSECIEAKSKMYEIIDGKWIEDKDILHRRMSNNSIVYFEKPTRDKLHWQMETMKLTGEPAFINAESAMKRRENFQGVNPCCFTGDMKLLTEDGYKSFEELSGKEIDIINKDGEISKGNVWSNGVKETVKISLSNHQIIKCTPDHIFMLDDSTECEAKDLKGKRIMPYLETKFMENPLFIQLGFIQGDGCTGRINSETHKGMEVNIGYHDDDIKILFGKELRGVSADKGKPSSYYLNGFNEKLIELGFDGSPLPERVFPITYSSWSDNEKQNFLRGCYSANGSIITHHRVSYKTTSKVFALQLKKALLDFGMTANITINKPKKVLFNNGEYLCKESYDICLNKYSDILKFQNLIGFYQAYKKNNLIELIKEKNPKVTNVINNGSQKVYDFSEPLLHWGVVENLIVHNCEILLDSRGLCNLTTVNVLAFVKDGKLDIESLLEAQKLSARTGYRMTCVDLELHKWDLIQKRDRLIGTSVTGWQDMKDAVNMTIEEEVELLHKMRDTAHISAKAIAKEIGGKEPLLTTTVKPEGTLSQVANGVSSGLHMAHSPFFIRRIRINANDPLVKVCEDLGYPVFPETGEKLETCNTKVVEFPCKSPAKRTKYDVSAIEQLETYKRFQDNYTDHNSSITVTVKNDEWNLVEQWLWDNWNTVVGISFLSLDNSVYPLLPYEAITEEEYNRRVIEMKPFIPSLLKKYEVEGLELDAGNDGCESGVCPIR